MSRSVSPLPPPPAAPQGLRVFRKIAALCAERRFALCISLWEYHVPLYIEAARAPMGLIQVATRPAPPTHARAFSASASARARRSPYQADIVLHEHVMYVCNDPHIILRGPCMHALAGGDAGHAVPRRARLGAHAQPLPGAAHVQHQPRQPRHPRAAPLLPPKLAAGEVLARRLPAGRGRWRGRRRRRGRRRSRRQTRRRRRRRRDDVHAAPRDHARAAAAAVAASRRLLRRSAPRLLGDTGVPGASHPSLSTCSCCPSLL